MTRKELEALIQLNGFNAIYLQKSIPMDFVEDYIEFLDIPYLFYMGYLTHDFADKNRCEIEEFIGAGGVNVYLNLQEYTHKYFKKELSVKNYGLPKQNSQNISKTGVKLQLDYGDYEITFSINNNTITIYFELSRLPKNAALANVSFTNTTQIKSENFDEDTFLQTINGALIGIMWNLYFDF